MIWKGLRTPNTNSTATFIGTTSTTKRLKPLRQKRTKLLVLVVTTGILCACLTAISPGQASAAGVGFLKFSPTSYVEVAGTHQNRKVLTVWASVRLDYGLTQGYWAIYTSDRETIKYQQAGAWTYFGLDAKREYSVTFHPNKDVPRGQYLCANWYSYVQPRHWYKAACTVIS
jgi:hypothetical protein